MRESQDLTPVRCWEYISCGRPECTAHGTDNVACWLLPDSRCFDRATCLTERLSIKCVACPVFLAHRTRAVGLRTSDGAVIDTMDGLLAECSDLLTGARVLKEELKTKSAEVTLLSEVGKALQSTMELDDLLMVILTAVTAGDGLGFNRAFLLMLDDQAGVLAGRVGVGPSHPGEAAAIWGAMRHEARSLGEILSATSYGGRREARGILDLARRLSFPFDASSNIVARSLEEGKTLTVHEAHESPEARELARLIKSDSFIVAPLVAKGRKLGAVVADNFVTGRMISRGDVRLLETLASQAALAILNASLHSSLQRKLGQLQEAHRQLMLDQLQLMRAERLVAAGGLASTFVHEIRTPLVSIGIMARAAAADRFEEHKVRETLEKIGQEIVNLENSLTHLVKSAGGAAHASEAIDVSDLIYESLDLLAGLIGEAGIETGLELRHGQAKVMGSMVELRQMLLNILHNSVEAMPGGGRLLLRTEVEGPLLKVCVKDTGCGMPEHVSQRVFSPFFTTKRGGSGLGLVIARRIADDHGGRLTFETEEGAGTCFHILLPAILQEPEEADSQRK